LKINLTTIKLDEYLTQFITL